MKISTNIPILSHPSKIIEKTSQFWDKLSYPWKKIWGIHIHHGFYETLEESSLVAQEKLIDKLASLLEIKANQQILDVGCGMGGTSIFLAQKYHTKVNGITISSEQVNIANSTIPKDLTDSVQFAVMDAHALNDFTDNSFDIVWTLESCEQFYDKELFIKQAFRVLKPNGKLMIATWCSDQEYYEGKLAKRYRSLCKNFDLPYMPTINEYSKLLDKNVNFNKIYVVDWSAYVKQSFEFGIHSLKKYSWFHLCRLTGFMGIRFISQLKAISEAFKTGQLRYGVFVYSKI